MIGWREELGKPEPPAQLLPTSPTAPPSPESPPPPQSPASPASPASHPAQADVKVPSHLRFSPEEQLLGIEAQAETEAEGPTPWWCSRLAFGALVLLLTLILTSVLLYYGRAHLSEAQMADLEERMEEIEDANGTISAAHADTLMGHVIDVPRRCEEGFRYFRGRCRRMF